MYKLIVSDLDGTLLNDASALSEYSKEVIHRASEQGVDFMLATGRLFGGARMIAKELNLNTPILACNGALIKEAEGKLLYGKPLREEALRTVFRLLEERNLYFHCYSEDSFYTKKIRRNLFSFYDALIDLPEEDRFPMVEIEPADLIGKDAIYKILVRCEGAAARKELYNTLIGIDGVSVTVSFNDTFDICADQVSKEAAVERYASGKGIDPSEIICFGDNYNDIGMIRYAGLGIAVENGVEEIKEAADYVTASNNENGVAKAIEKFVFKL
ncbi:MAG TPA: Cof-type HAD-IIB family hydrolase [Bacillota bacterium]|nr:Cof-type HAD-IIB family hydrolase [Bacillota bacterium]